MKGGRPAADKLLAVLGLRLAGADEWVPLRRQLRPRTVVLIVAALLGIAASQVVNSLAPKQVIATNHSCLEFEGPVDITGPYYYPWLDGLPRQRTTGAPGGCGHEEIARGWPLPEAQEFEEFLPPGQGQAPSGGYGDDWGGLVWRTSLPLAVVNRGLGALLGLMVGLVGVRVGRLGAGRKRP